MKQLDNLLRDKMLNKSTAKIVSSTRILLVIFSLWWAVFFSEANEFKILFLTRRVEISGFISMKLEFWIYSKVETKSSRWKFWIYWKQKWKQNLLESQCLDYFRCERIGKANKRSFFNRILLFWLLEIRLHENYLNRNTKSLTIFTIYF